MISKDIIGAVTETRCGLETVIMHEAALLETAEKLEATITEATNNLDSVRNSITTARVGIIWALRRAVEDYEAAGAKLRGIHAKILKGLQDFNDAVGAPMSASDIKAKIIVESSSGELSVSVALQDLVDAGLVVRGGPNHPPHLRGKLWTTVTELRSQLDTDEAGLKAAGNVAIPSPRSNVVELRSRCRTSQ
jgi:hypothetical protein